MPALPDAPGCLRIALSGSIDAAAPFLTRFYTFYTGTAPTVAELNTFNTAVATSYTTHLDPLVDTMSVITQIETIDLTSPTAAVATKPVTLTGTRSGGVAPSEMCVVVSYEIARRYRGGHPRGYWRMGTLTDYVVPKQWSGTLITAVNTGVAAFMTDVNAAGWSGAGTLGQVNVSYYKGFTVVTNPTTGRARNVPTVRSSPLTDAVTAIAAKTSVGTQRRRLQFVD